jgi:hypothetical protein
VFMKFHPASKDSLPTPFQRPETFLEHLLFSLVSKHPAYLLLLPLMLFVASQHCRHLSVAECLMCVRHISGHLFYLPLEAFGYCHYSDVYTVVLCSESLQMLNSS